MAFHVTSSDEDDTWDDDYSDSKNTAPKKKPRTEAESSSGNSYLVAHVTSSNLSRDTLSLLKAFARSNDLNERCCEIDLMNLQGKSWTLGLRYNKKNDRAYIRGGWRSFCFENGLEVESFHRFKLVRNGTRPMLRLCSETIPKRNRTKPNGKDHLSEKSSNDFLESVSMKQNKFLKITFKPYMLTSGQLRLPRPFVRDNGIKEGEEITLVDKDGVKWPSFVACATVNEQKWFYMAKGWRSFCAASKLKSGVSFALEFVRGGGNTTPLLKFCSMANVKIEQTPVDGIRETVQASRDGEEEAKTRFQKRARFSVEGGPSCRSSSNVKNVNSKQPLQPISISDHMTKVKQSIVDTLACVTRFQSVLEINEQNLEASLQDINALGEKVSEINQILK